MSSHEKITSEATQWVIRVEAGLDGAEQDAFLEWLAADPRHGTEYNRQQANWARLDILADWRPEHAVHPNRDLLAPRKASVFEWLKNRWRLMAGISFGAATVAACVVLFLSGTVRAPSFIRSVPSQGTPLTVTGTDPISTIEQSKLDDGTIVELNRGSSITVMYTATERYVRLDQGEVNFHVAKDPSRPFIVNIDGVNVRAIGTSFNVRRDKEAVEVLVTSGIVQVHADESERAAVVSRAATNAEDAFVGAGQMAVVSLETQAPSLTVQTVATDAIENMIAWHPRLLDISEQSLASVVEEFNKRNAPIRLALASPDLADTMVSATLRSDQVENFVRLLEVGFGVKAERDGNVVMLHKKQHG